MKYLPLVLGIVCILGASYRLYRGTWLLINGQFVEGVVIRNEKSSGKSTVYYPIVQFQTPAGQTYECKGQSGTYPAEYEVNDTAVVHYNPAQPTDAFIGSFFGLVLGMLFSLALGAVFVWLGLRIVRRPKAQAIETSVTLSRN
ncbi:DUF3592 domain-containing protein [Spirosoma soli]|uniref:DUF3592 domain-containing protein n=1 Tax=Spirosoma soli TaxID=1770529 RepID=A0ABW5M4T4_9BACT